MKKILVGAILSILMVNAHTATAQAFAGKGSKNISISMGIANYNSWFAKNSKGIYGRFSPFSGVFSVQGEFGVHKYVGIGFDAGISFAENLGGLYGGSGYYGVNYWGGYYGPTLGSIYRGVGIPISFVGNFHFLQLIADKTGKSFADKMDVYGGLSLGAGPLFVLVKSAYTASYSNDIGVMLVVGPHVGFRYFPTEKIGIHAEVGYGKSLFNGGVTFKM
ncbi:MAG: hypothetical protein M9916_08980 [Crocinitomicaceae bacterium]|nr:hypothetical protein [Crocinitomicaceae bacterium]